MSLELPRAIGRPAPAGIDPRDRFVHPAIAIAKEWALGEKRRRLVQLALSDRLLDPHAAYDQLNSGRMPRRAGVIKIGIRVVGAIDLHAAVISLDDVELLPQVKEAVDPETKLVREEGLITLSKVGPLTSKIYAIRAIAEAINPDQEPWRAQQLGIDGRYHQNEHGIVIAYFDRFSAPFNSYTPNINSANGSVIVPRI